MRYLSYRLQPFVLAVAVFLLFSSTISRNLGASHDSITYINEIERNGSALFHPHHLLYHQAARTWLSAARGLGFEGDAAVIVSALNSLFGALCAGLFVLLLRRRLSLEAAPSLAVGALASVSYGFWFYSGCVEVYIIPLFFLLLTLFLLSDAELSGRRALVVGLAHGMAILFHQVHVLFAPVVLARLAMRRREGHSLGRPLLLYAASGAVTVLLPYLAVLVTVVGVDSIEAAGQWITSYAHIPGVSFWNPLALSTALKAGLGFSRAIIGGQFLFALPQLQAQLQLSGKTLTDEAFLVHELTPQAAYALLGATMLLGVLFAAALLLGWRRRRSLRPVPPVVVLTTIWLACYGAFFFFWDSSNVEFWIPQALCLWTLFAWLTFAPSAPERGERRRAPLVLVTLMTLLLAAINFGGSIRFLRDRQNDYYWRSIAPIVSLARPADLIVFGQSWIWHDYYERHATSSTLCVAELAQRHPASQLARNLGARIERQLRRGGRVLISEEAVTMSYLEDPTQVAALQQQLWAPLATRWSTRRFPLQNVHVLTPAPSTHR